MDSTPSGQARVRVTWARNRVCRVPTRWPPRCPAARECGVTTPRPRAAGDAGHPAQGLRPLLHTGGPGVARLHTALWPAGEGSQHCESGGPQEGLSRHTGPPGQSGRGRRSHEGPGLPAQGLLAPVWRTREHVQPPGRGLRPALASPSWRQGWSVSGECGPRDPGGVFLQLQVRGTLVLLCLGAVTLTCLLGLRSSPSAWSQGCPEEGPARPGGLGSRVDWDPRGREARRRHQQKDSCRLVLVESIPQDLRSVAGSPAAQPLAQAWMQLLDAARESVHVASFYWSLTGPDIGVNDSSSQPLQQLLDRNVSLAVATSTPTPAKNSTDLQVLESRGAQVRHVPMGKLTGGVLHSKFWVVDGRHIYVGSANMDWRSLTQVKELGAVIYNCSRLAQDLEKTFQTYWVLGTPRAVLPKPWPQNFSSHINRFQPLRDHFDGVPTTVYFSLLASAGHGAAGGGLQQGGARAPAGQLLAQHGPQDVPLPAVPAGTQQPSGQRVHGRESLHRARGEPLQHPLQQGEPQQVHGHGEGGLHRHVQLVGRLLQQHLRCGPGGQPEGLWRPARGEHRAGAAAAALRARLELPLRRGPGWTGPGPGLCLAGLRFGPSRQRGPGSGVGPPCLAWPPAWTPSSFTRTSPGQGRDCPPQGGHKPLALQI
ncbi:5'-3' exonuclease PLD4 isoform X2 [Bos javanicus]|uniref:5'-3' exonuclease PLD4 isoform X2 n=1 Tax=Bos javanicus TaxID=9906 RepID=UPI002AA938E1|nr:5'-3' exonuclease PLD4 isoform X2 [Bos javanicus]